MNHRLGGRTYSGEQITWRSKEILPHVKIGFCEICGFYHAFPYPNDEFLAHYYQSYEIPCPLHSEERGRMARLLLSRIKTSDSVVDIGCGKGEMLRTLFEYGFRNLYGTEFGCMKEDSDKVGCATVLPYGITEFCQWGKAQSKMFDCAVLVNVFEHVPEPIELMRQLKEILSQDGVLMFCVPNDFNVLQKIYLEKAGGKPWFLVLPDHVNYFSLESIDGVLEKAGYRALYKTVQYPMEFFLLQGDDYVREPTLGKTCHRKRVIFEEAFREMQREKDLEEIYEGFAKSGIGRDMFVIAKPLP